MKPRFPVLCSLLLFPVMALHAQKRDSIPNPEIDFRKVNMRQWAGYKPPKADNGIDAKEKTFFSRLFCGRRKGLTGKKGVRGPDLMIEMSGLETGDSVILRFVVTVPGNEKSVMRFFVNPRQGHIKFVSDGGDGGDGGAGNDGKKKGSFKNTCGGDGGDGGDGGNAGYIRVYVDETAMPFVNSRCMTFSNYGGSGGRGGKPGKSKSLKGLKKDAKKPFDGNKGMNGEEGMSTNRIVMVGPRGQMIGWR